MKKTLIINTMGEPSAGKSTAAHGLMYKLRCKNVLAEYIPEFAKELTWSESKSIACQQYILGEMLRKLEILNGKVDVIVTDGPLILAAYYNIRYATGKYNTQAFTDLAVGAYKSFDNLMLFLERKHPYEQAGRNQKEEAAIKIREELKMMCLDYGIDYINMLSTDDNLNTIVDNYLNGEYNA
jgi:hypothetical protein